MTKDVTSSCLNVICASELSSLIRPAIKLKMHVKYFPRMTLRGISYILIFCWWVLWLFAYCTLMPSLHWCFLGYPESFPSALVHLWLSSHSLSACANNNLWISAVFVKRQMLLWGFIFFCTHLIQSLMFCATLVSHCQHLSRKTLFPPKCAQGIQH